MLNAYHEKKAGLATSAAERGNKSSNRRPLRGIWDQKHLKALLGMRRGSAHILLVEPWKSWIEAHGGVKQIRERLRTGLLSPNQRELLELILTFPDASAIFYASRLHLTPSPYFVRLSELMQVLLSQLNNWEHTQTTISQATNLPTALTPLVGAQQSLVAVVTILRDPGVRLLTLTGPGGVGKTRLALEAGASLMTDFHDGVFFAALESIRDPALLVTQIARSLNIETIGGESLSGTLKTYLRERQILLILDNFEQLVQSGETIVELLKAAPQLKLLVTSREPLSVYGELRYPVPELERPEPGTPPPLEQLDRWPALDLFVQRVRARHPDFVVDPTSLDAIVRICHRLDGLPLAIELAAAQVRLLAPGQGLPPLEYGLKALRDPTRDRPSRQKTMWDTIDWSYQLLSESEKAIFRQLAVFGREWSLEAAEAVCQMDGLLASLAELVDKNLLRYAGQDDEGDARFLMLQPVREFALEQLAGSGKTAETQRRHAIYFLEMVERAEPSIGTPGQLTWMRRIRQERENLQIALQWMLDQNETEMAFRLLGAAWCYYNILNIWDETKAWMDRALAQGSQLKTTARVKTLWGAAWLTTHYEDYSGAMRLAKEGLALARELGDQHMIGLLLQNVADGHRNRKEYDQAMLLLEESLRLFQQMDNKEEVAWILGHQASVLAARGERAHSMQTLRKSLASFRAVNYQWGVAAILWRISAMAAEDGDDALACDAILERLEIFRMFGAKQHISQSLYELAELYWKQDRLEPLPAMLEESLTLAREIGDRSGIARVLNFQGRLALRESHPALARELFEKAHPIFQVLGDQAALADNLQYLAQLIS